MSKPERTPRRILFLTQFFDPEPAYKGLAFVKALAAQGHQVEVITGFPNYPNGNVYPGYKIRFHQTDVMDGITVHRVPLYPSHDRSAFGRVLNYVTFAVSATVRALMRAGQADVIYVYHPPLTSGMAGALVGFLRRRPVVTEIQDMWPDTLRATGMIGSERLLRAIGWFCRITYRFTTRIIVQSRGFRDLLIERGVPEHKIDVVMNWTDERADVAGAPFDLAPYALEDRFNFLFSGTMGLAQGLDVILDAAARVAQIEPRIHFLLIGGGIEVERLRGRIAVENLTNVRVLPPVSRQDIVHVQDAADVLLVTLIHDPVLERTIPSKTQAYMARGKPILVSAAGEVADLVSAAACGVTVEPGDAMALADAAVALSRLPKAELSEMGARGRSYYSAHLSFAAGFQRTLEAIERAVSDYQRR